MSISDKVIILGNVLSVPIQSGTGDVVVDVLTSEPLSEEQLSKIAHILGAFKLARDEYPMVCVYTFYLVPKERVEPLT